MNWLGVIAILVGLAIYPLGQQIGKSRCADRHVVLTFSFLLLLALPGIVFALYYTHILGEPIWLYRLRSFPGTELLASLAGLLAGWLQVRMVPYLRLSPLGKTSLFPVLLLVGLSLPHLKPILRSLPKEDIPDQWRGDACMQSTASTCGPASAATILRHFGLTANERQLAVEAFTSASGTENWYLARAMERSGAKTSFELSSPIETKLPAIAGVRLLQNENTGHFIALMQRDGDKLIFNDPMEGFCTNTLAELKGKYRFTGLFLIVRSPD